MQDNAGLLLGVCASAGSQDLFDKSNRRTREILIEQARQYRLPFSNDKIGV